MHWLSPNLSKYKGIEPETLFPLWPLSECTYETQLHQNLKQPKAHGRSLDVATEWQAYAPRATGASNHPLSRMLTDRSKATRVT